MTQHANPDFGLSVSVEIVDEQVVLGIRGEVNHSVAPELGAILDAVIEQRQRSVVVDLGRCEFVDSSGLQMIAGRANRLGARGATLEIRSPSTKVRHLAGIMGLSELIELGQPGPSLSSSGPILPSPADDVARYLGAAVTSDDMVDSVLRLVVSLTRATVSGADGVSVSFRRRGALVTVAATDQTVLEMDADQYATGEGPCVDASVEGRWFHAESLDAEARWPAFTPRAQVLGIQAILSSPLYVQERPCGALNIYSRRANAFAPEDQMLASMIATEASTVVADIAASDTDGRLWHSLVEALGVREAIARAQGVLMERQGVGGDDAYSALRRSSMQAGNTMGRQAEDVVGSTRRPEIQPETEVPYD